MSRDVLFAGVAFWQTGLEGRQIVGHGPGSLYRKLMSYVPGTK